MDITINKLRSKLKDRVNDLRDIEGNEELKGFGLKVGIRKSYYYILCVYQRLDKRKLP